MSGAMRRIGEYLGLLEDTSRYDDEYDEYETQETAPVAARAPKRESRPAPVSDLAAGLVFATRGTIERVTNKVFLLSPPNVTVAAEDKQRIAEGGFFNQS